MLFKQFGLSLLSALCLLGACSPEELPVPSRDKETMKIGHLEMGEAYEFQVFYSLAENRVIQRNSKLAWDLAFETGPDGFHVRLNSSKLMYAYKTGSLQFPADSTGFSIGKDFDNASGSPDSTAIGDWREHQAIYLIDRGIDLSGQAIGMNFLKIESVDATGYQIRYQTMGETQVQSLFIPKKDLYSYTYFSFEHGGEIVEIAPPKTDWDFYFTQYSVKIPIPYLVTGALLNPYKTRGTVDSLTAFEDIDLNHARQLLLSARQDIIGYSWKTFDFNANHYQVNAAMNFILETHTGDLYKLHFIDFYSDAGTKGNPKWEVLKF